MNTPNLTTIFYDSEFTGLHQHTTLISIGLVANTGEMFYAEFTDYDRSQLDDWLIENVIKNTIWLQDLERTNITFAVDEFTQNGVVHKCLGNSAFIKDELIKWISQFEYIEVWSDCYSFDWVLLLQLFGGAFSLPKNIYYIPFDLATLFKLKGIDPDINRKEFSGLLNSNTHNALDDALVIKVCHEKLINS